METRGLLWTLEPLTDAVNKRLQRLIVLAPINRFTGLAPLQKHITTPYAFYPLNARLADTTHIRQAFFSFFSKVFVEWHEAPLN
jgi:hypothetical protein